MKNNIRKIYFHVVITKGVASVKQSKENSQWDVKGSIAVYREHERVAADKHALAENLKNTKFAKGNIFKEKKESITCLRRIEKVDGDFLSITTSYDDGKTWQPSFATINRNSIINAMVNGHAERVKA